MKKKWKGKGNVQIRMVEECGEVLQALGKAERFGYENRYPKNSKMNYEKLLDEITDLEETLKELRVFIDFKVNGEKNNEDYCCHDGTCVN